MDDLGDAVGVRPDHQDPINFETRNEDQDAGLSNCVLNGKRAQHEGIHSDAELCLSVVS